MQNSQALGLRPQTPVPPAAGGFAPNPPASGGGELRPQTPIGLRRLGAPPPDPQNSPPIANFWLRACLVVSKFRDRRSPVRDTGRQTSIPGLSWAFRDGWQP